MDHRRCRGSPVSPLAGTLAGLLAFASVVAARAAAGSHRRRVVGRRLVLAAGGDESMRGTTARLPQPPQWLLGRLASAGVETDACRVWAGWLGTSVAVIGGGALLGGPGLAAVMAMVVVVAPVGGLATAAGRAERRLEEALPGVLEAVARALRSGASLVQAIDEAATTTSGPLGAELRRVTTSVHDGIDLVAAIDAWGRDHDLAGVRLAVSALALGAETGGAHARAVDGVAATIRSRLAVSREVRALSSQARLSGVVITLAPLGFAVLATATDERTAAFLLRTPLGLMCLSAGLTLDGLAALWMHRLARID